MKQNELNTTIKVREMENGMQTVLATELYNWLEPKTEFSHWVKRMLKYGFIENVDYWEILPINSEQGKEFTSKMTETPKGFYSKMSKTKRGRPAKEYILSLDCAKSIAMLQRNERGKRTRQYFLLCEKKAHQQGNEQIEALQAELAIYRRMEQINSLRRKLNAEMRILKEQLSSIIPVQLKLAL